VLPAIGLVALRAALAARKVDAMQGRAGRLTLASQGQNDLANKSRRGSRL